jgi:uncharacterized protein YebE (UPF0316 family)
MFPQGLDTISPIVICLIVCLAKMLEITIQSLKTCMLVKGHRGRAAILGFVECLVWGLVISAVVTSLSKNFILLLCYCFGYSMGLMLGSSIEKRLALGTTSVQLMVNEKNTEKVTEYLKEHHRGYTVLQGHGAVEVMNVIIVILPRKDVKKMLKGVKKVCDNHIFAVTGEVSKHVGGYGVGK